MRSDEGFDFYSLVNVIIGFALFQMPQGLGKMIVQYDSFMTKFANKKVLLLDLHFKRQGPLELLLGTL